MAYLGNDLQVAFPTYRNIDDISGSFNGVTTSFPLTVAGVAPIPAPINSQQCLISVNGVVQRPDDSGTEGFRLSGGNIIFASAPAGGVDFFGVILAGADYVNIGANFPSGTAVAPSITFDSDLDTGIYNPAGNQIGFTTSGVQRLVINSSGQISGGLGTAAAPVISFISDPNTGIYSPGADQVAISTNGAGRLSVQADGNVLIGATGSATRLLTVNQTGTTGGEYGICVSQQSATSNAIEITIDSANGVSKLFQKSTVPLVFGTSDTERLRITSAGLVGVGTSSPSYLLHVSGNGAEIGLTDTAVTNATWRLLASTGGSTKLFRIYDSSNAADRLVIDSSGRVGIGTSAPGHTIDVAGTGRHFSTTTDGASLYLSKTNSGTANQGGNKVYFTNSGPAATARNDGTLIGAIQFQASQPTSGSLQNCGAIEITADGTQSGLYTPTKISFSTANNTNSGSNVVAMTIDSSQRVGIGDTGPDSTLTIKAAASTTPLRVSGPSSEFMRCDQSGRLLVGTSSAQSGTRSQYSKFTVQGNTQSTGDGAQINLANNTNAPSLNTGDTLGQVIFTDNGPGEYGKIACQMDGAGAGTNDYPGRLVFSTTADGASSPTERMRINRNGLIQAQGIYDITTATAANVNVGTSGELQRSVSSIKYKINVETLENQYADALLSCRPVWYQSACEADRPEWGHWGFIAEEVAQIDPRLCFFKENADGSLEPEGVQYDRFVPHLLNLIKRQQQAIETLEAKVAALESV